MATKPKSGAAAPASKSTAVVAWDQELAEAAAQAAKAEENTGGGQFFSVKGGILNWNDAPVPNNTLAAIIVGSVFENVYYEGEYDPDTPQAPTCFAFSKDEKTLTPHKAVVDAGQAQHELNPNEDAPEGAEGCAACGWNVFGTAERGRGKACRNTRRLGLLAAGTFDNAGRFQMFEAVEQFESSTLGFMKLPVTSVTGYGTYVKQVAETLKRPPWAMVTKIKVVPDAKTQFKVLFEPLAEAPQELLAVLKKRHQECTSVIEFPYPLELGANEAPVRGPASRKGAAAAKGKAAAPAKKARRY